VTACGCAGLMLLFKQTRADTMKINILKSLMNPAAYPVPATSVELVQTHVSWIFLTDTHAFKIKKPVNFGFLDFSTVDKRRFYCEEEVRLNRRLCPDIYEGVIEVRQDGDKASYAGDGPVLDFAVMMKRLPADRMLDKLVEKGEATVEMMKNIAGVISSFHKEADSSEYISEFGSLDKVMFNWNENFDQIKSYITRTLPANEYDAIFKWVNEFAKNNNALFKRRVEQGYIRECDGDLHLENICLIENKVYIFDCIEFNERFRYCDTAADIAFLLMDLDFHGHNDLSDAVHTAYSTYSNDIDLDKIVDFYKVYRAFIRGKVESFLLDDNNVNLETKQIVYKRAGRYFRLARGYCERSRLRPTLFITCGTMGSGKSTLADQLAFELGISKYNSDSVRKIRAGIRAEGSLHEQYGQGIYNNKVTGQIYEELKELAAHELGTGRSVVIDASFRKASDRADFSALADLHSANFVILFVFCNDDLQNERLISRSTLGNSVSDGRVELLEYQRSEFEKPETEEGRVIELDAIYPPEHLTSLVYKELNQ